MDASSSADELNDALSQLETALLSPVVSGELESWARAAQEATIGLSRRLPSYLNSVLHPQYAEIAKSDPELLTRVEKLIAEDQNLLLEQEAFRGRVDEFVKRCAQIKKDEAQAATERAKLEQEGIGQVLRIKKQRAAADTWLAEANYRDRGPVD
jgi:regulator of replication initiation timing